MSVLQSCLHLRPVTGLFPYCVHLLRVEVLISLPIYILLRVMLLIVLYVSDPCVLAGVSAYILFPP